MIFDPLEHIKWTDETRAIDVKYIFRFWNNVDIRGDDDCWNWLSGKDTAGYGIFALSRKATKAHRLSYLLTNGTLLKDLLVCHICDNRPCVNPNHLILGTYFDNMQDVKQRQRRDYKSITGQNNANTVLTDDLVNDIRVRYAIGYTLDKLAQIYSFVNRGSIYRIIKGVTWKHLLEVDDIEIIMQQHLINKG